MKYTHIFFDIDNTLFDFLPAETHAFYRTMESVGLGRKPRLFAQYRRKNLALWEDYDVERIQNERFNLPFLAQCGVSPRALNDRFLGYLSQHAALLDGAEEVCRQLSQHALLIAATNGFQAVQSQRMAGSALAPYFAAVISSEAVGCPKPGAAYFDAAFQLAHCADPTRALMVGDSLRADIQGAANVGMDACWVNPQRLPAPANLSIRYQVQALTELPALLGL